MFKILLRCLRRKKSLPDYIQVMEWESELCQRRTPSGLGHLHRLEDSDYLNHV